MPRHTKYEINVRCSICGEDETFKVRRAAAYVVGSWRFSLPVGWGWLFKGDETGRPICTTCSATAIDAVPCNGHGSPEG